MKQSKVNKVISLIMSINILLLVDAVDVFAGDVILNLPSDVTKATINFKTNETKVDKTAIQESTSTNKASVFETVKTVGEAVTIIGGAVTAIGGAVGAGMQIYHYMRPDGDKPDILDENKKVDKNLWVARGSKAIDRECIFARRRYRKGNTYYKGDMGHPRTLEEVEADLVEASRNQYEVYIEWIQHGKHSKWIYHISGISIADAK